MRKYYQLLLVIVSCCSLGVLLMYKSENNRLKYVLQVVNFFGRRDASFLARLGNATQVDGFYNVGFPVPLWRSVGDAHHAYTAYWFTKESTEGGEACTIVVGRQGSLIDYKCSLKYDNGKTVKGKFRFLRVDNPDSRVEYNTYWFFCTLRRSVEIPVIVVFMETMAKVGNEIKLHMIKSEKNKKHLKTEGKNNLMTICVNMVDFQFISDLTHNYNLLQFFLYHEIIGVKNFLLYNSDALPVHIQQVLHKTDLNIHYFPFNFPFGMHNGSKNIPKIIKTDCILRNLNNAQYTVLLSPNEFVYSGTVLNNGNSIIHALDKYSMEVTEFEIITFAICLDNKKQLLMDNYLYDPEFKFSKKIYVDRTDESRFLSWLTNSQGERLNKNSSVTLPLSTVLAHYYVECWHVKKEGLRDWRTSMSEDFLQQFQTLRSELHYLM